MLMRRLQVWFNRTGSESLGWLMIVAGIFMMLLPGPGMLSVVAGVALLARHYAWADAVLDPLHQKAVEGATFGVATIPRIMVSVLGVAGVAAVGVIWWASPTIPEFSILGVGFGPELPAAGWPGGVGLIFSAFLGAAGLIYSIVKFRTTEQNELETSTDVDLAETH